MNTPGERPPIIHTEGSIDAMMLLQFDVLLEAYGALVVVVTGIAYQEWSSCLQEQGR